MIHDVSTLSLISQILRQSCEDYIEGKDKIEEWKQEWVRLKKKIKAIPFGQQDATGIGSKMTELKNKMNIFWCAEEFWFDFNDFGESEADKFWDKYKVDYAGWDIDFFRAMLKRGIVKEMTIDLGVIDANNERGKQDEGLLDDNDRERRVFGGSGTDGAFGIGSRDCSKINEEATRYAGCVC